MRSCTRSMNKREEEIKNAYRSFKIYIYCLFSQVLRWYFKLSRIFFSRYIIQYNIDEKETLQIDYLIKTCRETFTQFDNYRRNGGNTLRPKRSDIVFALRRISRLRSSYY